MRSSIIRLAAVAGCVAAVVSCDAGPVTTVFGNGIAGGVTGTAPVAPLNPSAPDTEPPFVVFCGVNVLVTVPCANPPAQGNQVNVGDSILIVVRGVDNRQLTNIAIEGVKFVGDPNLGTLTEVKRYPAVASPGLGAQFPVSPLRPTPGGFLQDTLTRRYLFPALPLDSAPGQVLLRAIASDGSGNVDTAFHTINVVLGPSVSVLTPLEGDSVSQGSNMLVQVRVTHNVGVQSIRLTVQGETNWPPVGALNAAFTDVISSTGTCAACRTGSTVRDVTVEHIVPIPDSARVGGRITITASATDLNSNPGAAPPRSAFVRLAGTTIPKVTQVIPPRLEATDSITIFASGDNIDSVGFTIKDSTGAVIKDSATIVYTAIANRASSARRDMRINMPPIHQGKRVKISTYAVDTSSGRKGYSVENTGATAQDNASLAFQDTAIIVFGQSYALPRAGTVGDLVVDTVVGRARAIVSNMDNNRLDVWSNVTKTFDQSGIAVGSQPWGMNPMLHKDSLLVSNSGGTNISRVYLGDPGGAVSTMRENLPARIRTRTNFIWTVAESFDAGGFVHFALAFPIMYSDRPQYVAQVSDGTIYLSTRPTTERTLGTVRYLNPGQAFPDMKTFAFTNNDVVANYNFLDIDSVRVRPAGIGRADTLILYDHLPGTLNPSDSVRAPTCAFPGPSTNPTVLTCSSALDPRFDARFPDGIAQGAVPAILALQSHSGTCAPSCSDGSIVFNRTVTGITDTTFLALSANRNWIAIGQGNEAPGDLMMCNHIVALSPVCSASLTMIDLTNNAAERIFGLAIDSTGFIVGAHGVQTYFAAVEDPLHLRLQGVYGGTGTGGAGIAFHPRANGQVDFGAAPPVARPDDERLAFIADGSKAIHAIDIAFFIRRGRFELKHQLYGPLRVTRPLQGDNPTGTAASDLVILKLYGVSIDGGLTVIDIRARDILPVP